MTKRIPLNLLELVGISENQTVREAIEAAMENAKLIDKLGFKRLWFAEHHNTKNLASVSTAQLIQMAADRTENIRVGSGGIMLPKFTASGGGEFRHDCTDASGPDRPRSRTGAGHGSDDVPAHYAFQQ